MDLEEVVKTENFNTEEKIIENRFQNYIITKLGYTVWAYWFGGSFDREYQEGVAKKLEIKPYQLTTRNALIFGTLGSSIWFFGGKTGGWFVSLFSNTRPSLLSVIKPSPIVHPRTCPNSFDHSSGNL